MFAFTLEDEYISILRFKLISSDPHSDDPIKKSTQRAYYAFRLHFCADIQLKILHFTSRLFQEFIIDAYAQIEQNRLQYLRFNQTCLRADLYKGLADAAADGSSLHDIGNRTVLPSSFTGCSIQTPQLIYRRSLTDAPAVP